MNKIYSITSCIDHNMEYVLEDRSSNPNIPGSARVSRYYVVGESGLQKEWYIPEITATDFKDCLEADEIILGGENGYYADPRKLELYIRDSIVRLGQGKKERVLEIFSQLEEDSSFSSDVDNVI